MNIFANRVSVGSRVVFPLVKFTRKMVPVYPYTLFFLRESFFELSKVCLRARTSRQGIIFILQGVVRAELYTLRITRTHVAFENAAGSRIVNRAAKWAGHRAHTTADAAGCIPFDQALWTQPVHGARRANRDTSCALALLAHHWDRDAFAFPTEYVDTRCSRSELALMTKRAGQFTVPAASTQVRVDHKYFCHFAFIP